VVSNFHEEELNDLLRRYQLLAEKYVELMTAAMKLSGVARTLNKHIEILESACDQEVARSSLPANFDVDVLYPAQNAVIDLCKERD
jgi:hypothetical protein